MSMKVLILAPQPFYEQRGTPIAVKMLAEAIASYGHEVDLLVFHEGEDIEMPGVRLLRVPGLPGVKNIPPGFSPKKLLCDAVMFPQVFWLRLRKRYDVIHAVEESAFMAMAMGMLTRTPFVFDMDSSMPAQIDDKFGLPKPARGLLDFMERMMIRRSAGVVAVCKELEDIARASYADANILRLEDVTLLDHDAQAEDLREEVGIGGVGEATVAMYVGNLESYQGIDLLVDSMKIAAERQPDLHAIVIGGSDEHIAAYKQKVASLGLAGRVHLVGRRPIDKLAGYLRQADILLSPRTQGGNTPMKVYSYLDSGVAVLATDLSTHTQVMDDSISALAAPEAGAFAEALVALAGDPERRRRLAEAARRRVAEEFSPAAYNRKLSGFYARLEDAIGRRGGSGGGVDPASATAGRNADS